MLYYYGYKTDFEFSCNELLRQVNNTFVPIYGKRIYCKCKSARSHNKVFINSIRNDIILDKFLLYWKQPKIPNFLSLKVFFHVFRYFINLWPFWLPGGGYFSLPFLSSFHLSNFSLDSRYFPLFPDFWAMFTFHLDNTKR